MSSAWLPGVCRESRELTRMMVCSQRFCSEPKGRSEVPDHLLSGGRQPLSPTTTGGAAGITSRKRIRLRPKVACGEAGYPYPLCLPRVSSSHLRPGSPGERRLQEVGWPGSLASGLCHLAGAWFEGAEACSRSDQHPAETQIPTTQHSLPSHHLCSSHLTFLFLDHITTSCLCLNRALSQS